MTTDVQKLLQAARNRIDWDAVLDYLIQTVPGIVADAIDQTSELTSWEREVKAYASPSTKVPTIKLCRELSGKGLKDAKDWVEANCPEFQ